MLLVLELGGRLEGLEIPVMVEDFDLDARTWIKLRLAPMCPWIGVVSFAFVEQPRIQVRAIFALSATHTCIVCVCCFGDAHRTPLIP